MKSLLAMVLLFSVPLHAVEPVDPGNTQLYREQNKVVDKTVKNLNTIPITKVSGLYRSWINPVKSVKTPASESRAFNLVTFPVRSPSSEQTFSKNSEWKPGKVVKLFGKSKDFDRHLNSLALKDFNRFNYLRNPSSP
jgi:hypothetical protein